MKKTKFRMKTRGVYATAALVALVAGVVARHGGALVAANAPRDALVVYPASATSKSPETVAALPPAIRPVPETGDYDPETPLGQVRTIVETLRRLREGQQEGTQSLSSRVERLEASTSTKLDELRAALDANTSRLATLETAVAQGPSRARTPAPRATEPSPRPSFAFWRAMALALAALLLWDRVRRRELGATSSDRTSR